MRAMTVVPGEPGTAAVDEVADPARETGGLIVRGLLVGVCGTDREIADGAYGEAPSGQAKLIIGHEGLGEVLEAPEGSGFQRGDLVVGIVRRPDPVPCPACAGGEWDMCSSDRFCERGIVREHGYGSERWRVEPEFAIAIPTSTSRRRNASPAEICSPMTSDHQWASQKTSAEPNALVVMTRASCPYVKDGTALPHYQA